MKLHNNRKKGTLLYEGIVGLFILGSFTGVILNSWHDWNRRITTNRAELKHEREVLNEYRQKL